MKNIKLIVSFCLLTLIAITSCSDDDYKLGTLPDKSEITYDIYQDLNLDPGGNTVIVKNTTPETILTWNYGTGKSTRKVDTIRYAFKGDYTIDITATTGAGLVYLDPVTISVTDDNLNYVNDPLWTALSGGVGNSKTWVLDLDANAVSKFFLGPQYFYGTDNGWIEGGNPSPDGVQPSGCYGEDCWNWNPDYPGNSWIMPAADYGTMTFSLDGGPFVTVEHLTIPARGTENGTYFLDSDNKTLTMTDATILHPEGIESCIGDWANMKIFSLTDDTLQIGVLRKDSCDGAAYLVYNFISKEYSDNWVPEETGPVEPTLPDGWENTVSEIKTTAIEWKLSENNPLDWANLDGTMMNGWQNPEDYPDWLGTPDTAIYGGFSMTMDSEDKSVVFVTPDGTTTEGTYTIDQSGIYSFSIPVPTFPLINWANFGPDANNELRILNLNTDANGNITDLWLGAIDNVDNPAEYMAYHLVPNENGADNGGDNESTSVPFDNSKIAYGDLEGNGNLRLELYNEYGSTVNDPGLDPTAMMFSESVEVTFTLSGITLTDGAAGSYDTSMYYADADWDPNGNGDKITVNGDGTYTVTYKPGKEANGAVVFVIDIVGLTTDLTDPTAVSATIDSVVIK